MFIVKLTGTGVAPLAVSPTSLTFSSTVTGRTSSATVTLTTGWSSVAVCLPRLRKIFDYEQLPAVLDYTDSNRVHIPVKNVGAMRRRFYELGMNEVRRRTLCHVFRQPCEMGARLLDPHRQTRLSLKSMLRRSALRHHFRVTSCCRGQRLIPPQQGQSLRPPRLVDRSKQVPLRPHLDGLAICRPAKHDSRHSHRCQPVTDSHGYFSTTYQTRLARSRQVTNVVARLLTCYWTYRSRTLSEPLIANPTEARDTRSPAYKPVVRTQVARRLAPKHFFGRPAQYVMSCHPDAELVEGEGPVFAGGRDCSGVSRRFTDWPSAGS